MVQRYDKIATWRIATANYFPPWMQKCTNADTVALLSSYAIWDFNTFSLNLHSTTTTFKIMKKTILLLACMLLAMTAAAQSGKEHLTFMGIPLTGSITSFQAKLIKKGCTLDRQVSRISPVGSRAFNGRFAGENADIYVYYNEDSKTVYRAKAVLTFEEPIAEQKYNSIVDLLKTKYADEIIQTGEQEGHESTIILVSDNSGTYPKGVIGVYITKPEYSFMSERYIHIDYEDNAGTLANDAKKMDDL